MAAVAEHRDGFVITFPGMMGGVILNSLPYVAV